MSEVQYVVNDKLREAQRSVTGYQTVDGTPEGEPLEKTASVALTYDEIDFLLESIDHAL